jgi:hypothetical protein
MHNQMKVIRRLARRLARTGGSKEKRVAQKYRRLGSEIMLRGWSVAWSVPGEVKDCGQTIACTPVDISNVYGDFEGIVNEMKVLGSSLAKVVAKSRGGKSKFERTMMKRLDKRANAAMEAASHLPKTSHDCTLQ